MSTHKKIDIICIAAIIFAVALTALLMSGNALSITAVASEEAVSDLFTANDLNADWDTSSATKIILSDKGSTIRGNGAYVYDGDVYIVYAGHYVLTGELTDGNVIIDADKNDKIWISLDDVTLYCDDDAAIRVEQADKVFLTLADGTENTVSSGAEYNAEIAASGVDGTIYSRDDLTINGTGALVVNAAYNHGIVCNDDLVITGGSITVNAVQDGIHAHDSVCIRNSAISISAGDDGITVSNDDETAFLYVESGNISIPACYEGLEAIEITIAGGTIDIMPTDDGINANGSGTGSVIRILGGDIRIINSSGRDADGLDSNGSIYMEGGSVFISVSDSGGNYALDYGSENGGECVVSGGTVIACGSSAMAEGFDVDSAQGFLMYNTTAEAGTTIRLEDSLGRELLSEEIPCGFSSIVLSTPELKVGDTCTLVIGDVQEQITIDNSSSSGFNRSGMFGGGMSGGRGHGGAFGDRPNDSASFGGLSFPDGMESGNGTELPDGMEPPEGMEPGGGMEPPNGMEPPGSMEPSDGLEPPNGMQPTDGMQPPDGLEPGDSMQSPDGSEPFDGMQPPDGLEPFDGLESPDGLEPGDGMQSPDGLEPFDGLESPDGLEPGDGMQPPDGLEPFDGLEPPDGLEPGDSMQSPDGLEPFDGLQTGESEPDSPQAQETSGRPLTFGGRQPQGNGTHSQQRDWEQMLPQEETVSSDLSADTLILLGISVLALMVGLFIALKIKH